MLLTRVLYTSLQWCSFVWWRIVFWFHFPNWISINTLKLFHSGIVFIIRSWDFVNPNPTSPSCLNCQFARSTFPFNFRWPSFFQHSFQVCIVAGLRQKWDLRCFFAWFYKRLLFFGLRCDSNFAGVSMVRIILHNDFEVNAEWSHGQYKLRSKFLWRLRFEMWLSDREKSSTQLVEYAS